MIPEKFQKVIHLLGKVLLVGEITIATAIFFLGCWIMINDEDLSFLKTNTVETGVAAGVWIVVMVAVVVFVKTRFPRE